MDKKRRLSSGWSLLGNGNDGDVMLEPNDDEAEKRARVTIDAASPLKTKNKSSSDAAGSKDTSAKRRKSVGWNMIQDDKENFPSSSNLKASFSSLSNEQLTNLYSNCIKLCTENKINQKNSWQLNLIDYMEDVLEHQEVSGDNPNFQAASCTLDASVRIYSCRVDSVHTDTYKVLGGLTRTGDRGEEIEGGGEEENDGEGEKGEADHDEEKTEETEKKKKPKKLPVGGVHTLESNLDALNAKKIDLEFMIDPLFRKTSAAFDEGGAKGLLLNHLSVHHVLHGCELVFDSVDAIDVSTSSSTVDHKCDISELQDLLAAGGDVRDIADLEICPTFTHFQFDHGTNKPKVELKDEESAETENFDAGAGIEEEEKGFEGFDGADINFDAGGDADDDDAPRFNFGVDEVEQVVPNGAEPDVVTNDGWADFQHINPKLAMKWAGPDHWRFTSKAAGKSDGKSEGGETKKKTKSEKKSKGFFIDFLAPPPPESAFAPPGRTLTTLSAAVLKKASESTTTLPVDVHYDVSMLTQLFCKPKWKIPTISKRNRIENATNAGDAAAISNEPWYSSQADTSFAADQGGADDDDDHFGGGYDGPMDGEESKREEDGGNPMAADMGNDLVAEPVKIAKVAINYAKVAKKVDVKALKTTIWSELCDDAPATKTKEKEKEQDFEGERSFESLLEGVEGRAGKEVGEMSVALCFICVLHLCNEKGLSLTQEGIEDLHITGKT